MIAIWKALRPYLRRHRRLLALALAAMLGEVVTGLLAPWPLKYVFDSVLFTRSAGGKPHLRGSLDHHAVVLLVAAALAALLISAFDGALTYVDDRATTIAAQSSVDAMRRDLFAHLQALSLSFHNSVETQLGDLLSRLNGDIQALQDLAANGISNLVTNGLGLLTAFVVMLWLQWRLGIVAILFTVPMYLYAERTIRKMRLALRVARHQEGRVGAVLQEALSAVKLVQGFGREDFEQERLAGESSKSLDASLEASAVQSRLTPSLSMISAVAVVAVTSYGVVLVFHHGLTPGELLIFLTYLKGMQSPVRQLAKLSYAVGKATAGMERLEEVFAREPDVVEAPGAPPLCMNRGAVRFDHVTFGYVADRPVLVDLTLDVAPGLVVAVVGPTGAGKSTLVSLLSRFYDPWSGRVLIDGCDLRTVTLASLRDSVGLVLQDTLIFRATLAENIAYGRPDATRSEVLVAAAASGADALAARLADGYDTLISERGSSLSGGEKQCIGIARAILKDAPIIVLDEPTSAMDSVTESRVVAGTRTLLAGRTAFVIAHRLATVRDADLVAVIDAGRLVELGPPAELLKRDGHFAELARAQALVVDAGTSAIGPRPRSFGVVPFIPGPRPYGRHFRRDASGIEDEQARRPGAGA